MHPTHGTPLSYAARFAAWLHQATRRDFFPDVSRRMRGFVYQPLGLLVLASATAILCGLVVHPRVFALAGGLMLVAVAGVCWPWLTVRAVRAVLRFDRERAVEGAEVGVSAVVENFLPWPAWGLTVRDRLGGAAVRLPNVSGRSRTSYRWVFRPMARGEYPTTPPVLATGFPFGVWEAARLVGVERTLLVWPRTFPVGPVPTAGGTEAQDGPVASQLNGSTGEIIGVRPYRRGDSPRRIHWPQSAKHDRLVVCEMQQSVRPAVLVILDTDPTVHTTGPDGSFDWAVRVAASLVGGWLHDGAAVGLAWAGGFVPVNGGAAQHTRAMDALARVGMTEKPLSELFGTPAIRSAREAVRVAVTTDIGAARPDRCEGVRWVILRSAGFGDEANAPSHPPVRPWLDIPTAADLPYRLRHGTTEAAHGS